MAALAPVGPLLEAAAKQQVNSALAHLEASPQQAPATVKAAMAARGEALQALAATAQRGVSLVAGAVVVEQAQPLTAQVARALLGKSS